MTEQRKPFEIFRKSDYRNYSEYDAMPMVDMTPAIVEGLTAFAKAQGEAGSGQVCINGAAAHLVHPDDLVIILAYEWIRSEHVADHRPRVVHVDAANHAQPTVTFEVPGTRAVGRDLAHGA